MSSRKDPVFSQGAGHKILGAAGSLQSQTKVRFHQIFWLLERMECFCLFLSDLMCPRDPPCEEEEHVEEINAILPEEVLLKIFSFLSPSDLKASMLVCKLWTQVGQVPSLWRWATLTADETFLPAQLNLTRCFGNIVFEYIELCKDATSQSRHLKSGIKSFRACAS